MLLSFLGFIKGSTSTSVSLHKSPNQRDITGFQILPFYIYLSPLFWGATRFGAVWCGMLSTQNSRQFGFRFSSSAATGFQYYSQWSFSTPPPLTIFVVYTKAMVIYGCSTCLVKNWFKNINRRLVYPDIKSESEPEQEDTKNVHNNGFIKCIRTPWPCLIIIQQILWHINPDNVQIGNREKLNSVKNMAQTHYKGVFAAPGETNFNYSSKLFAHRDSKYSAKCV